MKKNYWRTCPTVDQFHWKHQEEHHSLQEENLSCSAQQILKVRNLHQGLNDLEAELHIEHLQF